MCKWCEVFQIRSKIKDGENKNGDKNKKKRVNKNDSNDDETESDIDETFITQTYKVPSNNFKVENDVFRKFGFDLTDEALGEGGYGSVLKARRIRDNQAFGCKLMVLEKYNERDKGFKAFMHEISTMTKTKHENIIRLETHFIVDMINENKKISYIIMEFASCGNVREDVIKRSKAGHRYSEVEVKDYFAQLVRGLDYLHFKGIAHRDLKLPNILITKQSDGKKVLKITDFGASGVAVTDKNKVIKTRDIAGTVNYMSPEVLKWYLQEKLRIEWSDRLRSVNSFMSDIWALGICLYFMLFCDYPFPQILKQNKKDKKLLTNMLKRQLNKDFKIDKTIGKISLNKYCEEILVEMLEPNRFLRIDISDVKCHKWLKNKITEDVDRVYNNNN